MVGASVHGLVGVDAELQRSAFAANQLRTFEQVVHQRAFEDQSRRVMIYKRDRNCEASRHPRHIS